jgi:adenylosuccinate synthase
MAYYLQHPDDAPRVGDTQDKRLLRRKLWGLHDFYDGLVPSNEMPPIDALLDIYHQFANWTKIVDEYFLPTLLDHQNVIFEGAQGVLLDQDSGFHPYTTWSKTTFANVIDLVGNHEFERIGVTRTYSTRHGAGPFPVEDPEWATRFPDPTNVPGEWQGNFRVGPLDLVLLSYAAEAVGGLDQIVLTHIDKGANLPVCRYYERHDPLGGPPISALTPPKVANERGYQQRLGELLARVTPIIKPTSDIVSEVETATGAPVTIVGYGPKAQDKQQRAAGGTDGKAVRELVPA